MTESILLDTNILIYSRDEESPFFKVVCEALNALSTQGFHLCVNNQILREYASVATRPNPKGLGLSLENTLLDINEFEASYVVLPDSEKIWPEWKRLAARGGFKGLRLHDVFIVAAMVVHEIKYILTLNEKDFKEIPEITPIHLDSWQNITVCFPEFLSS